MLHHHLPNPPVGDTIVIGFGKAAASMAAALENAIDARWPAAARYGHIVPTRTIRVLEASHPVPDAASLTGARALLAAVTVRGNGKGGRNQEFALGLALAIKGASGIHALAADTDGIDGVCDAAGAFVAPDTLRRAEAAGFDVAKQLESNDACPLCDALGDLHAVGPRLTNVNDFRAILIQS